LLRGRVEFLQHLDLWLISARVLIFAVDFQTVAPCIIFLIAASNSAQVPYLTAAAAMGMELGEVDIFVQRMQARRQPWGVRP
jgi:hypothetical protein